MSIFYVRNSDDNQRLRLYLFLFAEYDGEAEDGWARYRCEPEHEKRSRSTLDASKCDGVDIFRQAALRVALNRS